jgi:hypothetical protein
MPDAVDLRPLPGPIPSLMPSGYDLADVGYVEEEYLLSGTAESYRLVGERTPDGRWTAEPDGRSPYRTRILVRRPVDPDRFSGTVLVEWHNVSAGLDASPDWSYLHRQLQRRGDAWVGVSAQKAGIDGGGVADGLHLKLAWPDRYDLLDHPGDAYAFDIFSAAGRVVRGEGGASVLGPLRPTRVLAAGESQSAMYLTSYVNGVDALAAVYDGFFVHGRAAAGAPFTAYTTGRAELQAAMASVTSAVGEQIRADARVPVIVLQSETDVVLMGGGRAGQPDGDRVRQWEVAGAAHADSYMVGASFSDDGRLDPETFARMLAPVTELFGMATGAPINSGPQQHYAAHAAYEHLDRWAGGGDPPPVAPRLEVAASGDRLVLDGDGIATGGLRTPWVDVPRDVLSGLGQGGEGFAFLFGTTTPLPADRLAELYPGGRDDYLARFGAALDGTISAGHLLADDRDEILAVAAVSAASVPGW